MSEDFQYDVFVSYSSADRRRVKHIAEQLRANGLRVWFDQWEIHAGQNIYLRVSEGLTTSRVLVLCLSRASLGTEWPMLELSTVLFRDPSNRERRFVPLLLEPCDIPPIIRPFRYIDYRVRNEARAWAELLSACSVLPTLGPIVRPLHVADDRFLQVLLFQFSLLRRHDGALDLHVSFSDDSPAIWNSQGKGHLRARLDKRKSAQYKASLDKFILGGKGAQLEFNDALFPFRYVSGGTLPIIRLEEHAGAGEEYYCLFYREIHPIGWNLANGGCDTRAELLNPVETILRELREELIIADFANDKRYVFHSDIDKPLDHPAHAVARRLLAIQYPAIPLDSLTTLETPVAWEHGPDRVHVHFNAEQSLTRTGFYVNINAEDGGIELDRIARINLPATVTLFDGEIDGGRLVNSPIGLFKVSTFNRHLIGGSTTFVPDIIFYNAQRHSGRALRSIMHGAFLQHCATTRTADQMTELHTAIKGRVQYRLCPATEKLLCRHVGVRRAR